MFVSKYVNRKNLYQTKKINKNLQSEKRFIKPRRYYFKTSLLAVLPDGYWVLLWRSASYQYSSIYEMTDWEKLNLDPTAESISYQSRKEALCRIFN